MLLDKLLDVMCGIIVMHRRRHTKCWLYQTTTLDTGEIVQNLFHDTLFWLYVQIAVLFMSENNI